MRSPMRTPGAGNDLFDHGRGWSPRPRCSRSPSPRDAPRWSTAVQSEGGEVEQAFHGLRAFYKGVQSRSVGSLGVKNLLEPEFGAELVSPTWPAKFATMRTESRRNQSPGMEGILLGRSIWVDIDRNQSPQRAHDVTRNRSPGIRQVFEGEVQTQVEMPMSQKASDPSRNFSECVGVAMRGYQTSPSPRERQEGRVWVGQPAAGFAPFAENRGWGEPDEESTLRLADVARSCLQKAELSTAAKCLHLRGPKISFAVDALHDTRPLKRMPSRSRMCKHVSCRGSLAGSRADSTTTGLGSAGESGAVTSASTPRSGLNDPMVLHATTLHPEPQATTGLHGGDMCGMEGAIAGALATLVARERRGTSAGRSRP